MSEEGVDIVCKAAQRTLPDGSSGRPQFNEFVDTVVEVGNEVVSHSSRPKYSVGLYRLLYMFCLRYRLKCS